MTKWKTVAVLGLVFGMSGVTWGLAQQRQANRFFELRVYTASPDRMDKLVWTLPRPHDPDLREARDDERRGTGRRRRVTTPNGRSSTSWRIRREKPGKPPGKRSRPIPNGRRSRPKARRTASDSQSA